MKIKEMNEDSRPRERLVKFGVENLSNAELLALILEKGTKQENVIEVSNRLINTYGLDKLSECSLKELQEIKGIGFAKACQIIAIFEFNKRRISAQKPIKHISSAQDVFDYFHERLKDEKQEHFYVLMLNGKNNIIGEELVSKGILDASIIHPREVFKSEIKNSASKIILVHNHPSGDSSPSLDDKDSLARLKQASNYLGFLILDFVIIGKENYYSFKETTNK